jgi:cell division protein FtsB
MTDYQTPLNERTLISTQEYQQLRAEVERLKAERDTLKSELIDLRFRITASEGARERACMTWQAEKVHLANETEDLRAEVEQLRAENARLRGENVRQKSLIAQYELLLMPETKP